MCDVCPGDDAGKLRINVGMMMHRVRDRGLRHAHREPEQNHDSRALCGASKPRQERATPLLTEPRDVRWRHFLRSRGVYQWDGRRLSPGGNR